MKEIIYLKKAIKIFFFVFVSSLLLYPIKVLFAYMEEDYSYLGFCETSNYNDSLVWTLFFLNLISRIIFFIGGFYLLKTLKFNYIKEVFTIYKIKLFYKSGIIFMYSALFSGISIGVTYFNRTFASLQSNDDSLFSFYFTLIIGFFFIIFSKILKAAMYMKQENDLTI